MSTRRLLKRLQLSLNHDLKRLNVSKVPGTITTLFLKGVAWGWFVFLGIPPMLTTISLIPKCEQLYLLFTSIKISISMLVWKSSGCSLRKYIVLCTHIIVIKCYSVSFLASPYCTKALLICLENGFSHSIPSMFHVSRSRDIRTSPFWSYKDLNFEKIFRDITILALFRYFKWNVFPDSKSSGYNFGWSWHTFWWTSRKIEAGSF